MKNYIIYALIGLGVVAYKVSTDVDRDASGAIVDSGNVDAFSIQLGDCFDDIDQSASSESGEVASVPGVPCSEPHDNEVFAVFDVSNAEFPGEEAMSEIAFDACETRFEDFVGKDYQSSSLDITMLYPTAQSWHAQNDREVICAVFDVELNKLTGSMKDAAI